VVSQAVNLEERRRRVRRTALLLGAVALSFYVAFIVMSVVRSHP
jgi:ABC-type uncharacterized transport system permease subunit